MKSFTRILHIRMLPVAILTLIFIPGCGEKPPAKTKEQVIREKVEERIAQWKSDMMKNCMREINEEATKKADSIIIARAVARKDSTLFFQLPERPRKPDFSPPEDTIPVRPFLND